MKILYAIQGTGNGHLARATEIVPHLQKLGDVDILISGIQGDIRIPFEVKYKLYGLSFMFGKKGGVDFWKTLIKLRLFRFLRDIRQLPVRDYDLILNDFEPVSAWACRLKGKICTGISHQSAVLHPLAARPLKNNFIARMILKNYAPVFRSYGFHFKALDFSNFTPVIRSAIRKATPRKKPHYTVYLPAFNDDEIIRLLQSFQSVRWEVFSKYCREEYNYSNILFSPVSLEGFQQSFINCTGILCNAGFETPAEAIFMGKKLCVVPMKNQYEQACNAAMLSEMGVTVANKPADLPVIIKHWLNDANAIRIKYPDQTSDILQRILMDKCLKKPQQSYIWESIYRSMNWLTTSIPVSSRLHQRPL